MKSNISLHIDNPCSESWQNMTPNEQGRFCASCQKSVVDFTAMSDNELIDWFARQTYNKHQHASHNPKTSTGTESATSGHTCGRFTSSQLDRAIQSIRPRKPAPTALWRYLIAGLLVSSEASAQTHPQAPAMAKCDTTARPDRLVIGKMAAQPTTTDPFVSGILLDSTNGQPVQGASIFGVGTHKGTVTDELGHFRLSTTASKIVISSIGYVTQTITLDDKYRHNPELVILMKQDKRTLTGDVVVAGMVRRKPAPSLFTKIKDTIANVTGFGKKAFDVYPNPVNRGGSVNISLNIDHPGTYTAQLFSISGALLESMEIEGGQQEKHALMDIPSTLAPGSYVVRLSHSSLKKPVTQQIAVL